jgi:hypothetical protein
MCSREAFSPQKRTSSTSKEKIYYFFSIFLGHFCPPGSGPTIMEKIMLAPINSSVS